MPEANWDAAFYLFYFQFIAFDGMIFGKSNRFK